MSLLPEPNSRDFPIVGVNVPALEVSGDFYGCLPLADGRIGFNLGDVSGKGMNAALLMAKTSSLLHCLGKNVVDPCELLARVNEEITESATRGMFVTVVAGVYDPHSRRLCWANAGHQPPLFRGGDGSYREFPATDMPLGIAPGITFERFELELGSGSFFVFTDGITEGYGKDGKPLELHGLERLIDRHSALPARRLLEEIMREMTERALRLRDDVTLMVIREPG